MRQHFAGEEGVNAARFLQRYLLCVAQLAVGLVLDHEAIFAHGLQVRAVEAGLEVFPCLELAALGDDRRRGFVAPADRLVDGLLLRRAELVTLRLERRIEAGAEFVVVIEHGTAQCLLRPLCHLHQPLVALPCRGVEQLLAALGGHGLTGGGGFTVIAAVFAVVLFVFVLSLQPRLDGWFALGELGVERLAVCGVDLGAQRLIARGKT